MNTKADIAVHNITRDEIVNETTRLKKVRLSLLRLDKIHPVISGNKWFKLKYYIADAVGKGYKTLLSFGGPYSNHIIATAYSASMHGMKSVGIIRGEEPIQWSDTLADARRNGMQLVFLKRDEYDAIKRNSAISVLIKQFGECYIVPEGGAGLLGIRGAQEILQIENIRVYTHVVVAVGTGTTIAGILQSTDMKQQVAGISSMKNNKALADEIALLSGAPLPERFRLIHDYHFGGYARYTPALLKWMNDFYLTSKISLDFVYTGKMMFGIFDLLDKDFFPQGSEILAVHTGGLQGNRSLPEGGLQF